MDGSASCRAAVAFAVEEASLRGARLRVVRVRPRPVLAREDADEGLAGRRRLLAESVAGRAGRHPEVEVVEEVVGGHPVEQLALASRSALALVVGRRGRGGYPGMRLGSTVHGLLRHAECPVVTVPGPLVPCAARRTDGRMDIGAAGTQADRSHGRCGMTRHEPSDGDGAPRVPEAFGRAALVLLLTLALVCGAVATGALWKAGADADRERAAHRHRVTATTTGPAREPSASTRYGTEPYALAPATWEHPERVSRSGTVRVPPRTPPGRAVTVWVDDTGTPIRAPGDAASRSLTAVSGGVAVAGLVGAAGAGALLLVRRTAEGRRYAAWEREWERVEPVWSGRLRRDSGAGTDDD
ncbi:universal stress protein [Streptomyces sp. CS081A]|uniref:Rv1733c family protein n=2 Tax=Streptomyces TaxID=1883 RepID=UPI0013A59F60|nr:universal stress protein [Streptomyces sp. CS081A]